MEFVLKLIVTLSAGMPATMFTYHYLRPRLRQRFGGPSALLRSLPFITEIVAHSVIFICIATVLTSVVRLVGGDIGLWHGFDRLSASLGVYTFTRIYPQDLHIKPNYEGHWKRWHRITVRG